MSSGHGPSSAWRLRPAIGALSRDSDEQDPWVDGIYWGLASFFTPPTCVAIVVTAPIAGAPIWSSGWEAMRLGIAAFLVPIAFVLNPAILMIGDPLAILQASVTALLGGVAVAAGLRGFVFHRMGMVARLFLSLGGVLMIAPDWRLALLGAGLAVGASVMPAASPAMVPQPTTSS